MQEVFFFAPSATKESKSQNNYFFLYKSVKFSRSN